MAKHKHFKIAHLSDLHLTKTDGRGRLELDIFNPLKGMNNAFRKILQTKLIQNSDFILVTGDVSDRGDLESWQVFWSAIDDAGLLSKILVVPGNHDVCCLLARMPGAKKVYKDEDLKKAINGLSIGRRLQRKTGIPESMIQPTKFPCAISPNPRVVIFGLSSNNLGNFSLATNAMGDIGYYQLEGLARKLKKYSDIPVKIIALHHSPNIPREETARKRGNKAYSKLERIGHQIDREDRVALRLLSITHKVRFVAHGHLHMAEDRKLSGIRIIGAPATTEPSSKRKLSNDYHFYTYTVQGAGGRVLYDLQTVTV